MKTVLSVKFLFILAYSLLDTKPGDKFYTHGKYVGG